MTRIFEKNFIKNGGSGKGFSAAELFIFVFFFKAVNVILKLLFKTLQFF